MTDRCKMELCPNWSGDGDVCPCAVFGLERPVTAEVHDVATWFTLPKWTRAHEVEKIGSLGYIRIWQTACGREYRTPDHEYDDAPIQALADMPRCASCMRRGGQQ